ncbi:MAG: InlB B-repeat-containing protein, partial [Clostridia bacterium]|nr:InlB B-repeat-containing protein [Clostridia bacterium]
NDRSYAVWSVAANDWVIEPGQYDILVGASSTDIRLCATVEKCGEAVENQLVKHGCTATLPVAPTKDNETFDLWTKNDVPFDFSTAIEQDITLKALYKEKDRYGIVLGNGDGTGWGHDPADGYACPSQISFTQFEGQNVMALTLKDGDRTKKSATYLKIDRTGSVAESVRVASYKKYIGFRVYSPVQGAQVAALIHNGSAVVSKYYFVHQGWNEIVVDVQKFIEGSKVTIDENTPIYRFGIGAFGNEKLFNETTTGSATEKTDKEFTFYFDDVYATNFDMKDTVDFDSAGDINRYVHGTSSIYAVLRTQAVDYGNMLLEKVETSDGGSALKLTKNTKGQVHGSVAFKADGFFPKDLTGYTAIEVRVKSDFAQAKIWASLGGALADKNTQIYDGAQNAGEWVVYTFDLTKLADLTNVGDLQFRIEDGAVSDTSSEISFMIDYIKFIK